LTSEGIEPNPGPTWKELMDKLRERLGDDIAYFDQPLVLLKAEIEKVAKPVEASDVKGYLQNANNKESLNKVGITEKFARIILETIGQMEQGRSFSSSSFVDFKICIFVYLTTCFSSINHCTLV
jgi:hypothetical protein